MRTYKFNIIGIAVALISLCMTSCGDDYPTSKVYPYPTDLLSIKIVNGGVSGNETFEGTIDEDKKMVNFPRMDPSTDFSALKVEATLSGEATLEQYVYDFSMDEADVSKTLLLRVKNHSRYKDYFIRVRKNVPVYGANFETPTVYNFSGDNIYADANSLYTRCVDFDGEYVLVVARTAANPHLLKFSELKQGKITQIPLDITNMTGGTYTYNMGALANGHVYMASLSGSLTSPLKIYYWDTPTSQPEVIANIMPSTIAGVGVRNGDNISVNIDKNGNGFIFFGDNAGSKILRLKVTNHKTIDEPTVLASTNNARLVTNIYRIEDTSQYIWSAAKQPLSLTDENVSPKYTLKATTAADEGAAARVFTFNGGRYLIMCTAGYGSASQATPALYVYDITKGATVEEALNIFDNAANKNPVYNFILGGSGNAAPIVQTNYYIEKDANGNAAKLYLFAARSGSGFVICEVPIATEED